MKASDRDQFCSTPTDPSLEFDILEMARLRLVEALMSAGRPALEAERIALYVIEGLRKAPKFLNLLTQMQPPPNADILETLRVFLDEAFALEKARSLLLNLEDPYDVKKRTKKKGAKR